MANIFDISGLDLSEEFFETLASGSGVRIERIVSNFHASADGFWYNQAEDEFVCLLSGESELQFKEPARNVILKSGDWLLLKKHELHRVKSTSKNCVWLAVFGDFKTAK